jgi:septum formation protein
VHVPGVPELTEGEPEALAVENARRKAAAVSDPAGALVLAVDTVVACAGRNYSKPPGPEEARATLRALGGRVHSVISGLCLRSGGRERTAAARTEVHFRALSPALLEWYVATGEWRDRAGGYAIQGRGAALVTRIEGDYLNVVGLPLATLLDLEPTVLPIG